MKDHSKSAAPDTGVAGKVESLAPHRVDTVDDSLRAAPRGPTLLEDFRLGERITRFDHERIPERVVHARGAGAHGFFQVYEPLAEYTRADFLQDPSVKTPVFVRFSTLVGSRGSADTARDVRGFATKLYTKEGNFDLVGNNVPVFFIQDGIKFPDVVHAAKPAQDREIPQATTAHDTFWDFASLTPETTHMLMWMLSDRAIPRSFRMMEGFGVHTFRLVNAKGKSRFVKFHWKPLLGVHSLVWDEAQKIAGKDPDYHRRDLWEAIESGQFPEWELGLQIIEEADEHAFDFDLLDPTKLLPEELVPVRRVGKLTLDRNPDDFFAETEQVAFHTANVVPGIDFTDDPLLQVRNFSYLDTQLLRLGGPNFTEIPINRPLAPVRDENQNGHMRQRIRAGRANYAPSSLPGACPMTLSTAAGAFNHFPGPVSGRKARERSPSFSDHTTQAALFWNSQSEAEKRHLVRAARFELGKVETLAVRERMVAQLARVDGELARRVAEGVGVRVPNVPAAPIAAAGKRSVTRSEALSMEHTVKDTVKSRRVAILAAPGSKGTEIRAVRAALEAGGARAEIVAPALGDIVTEEGGKERVDRSLITTSSVLYDAVYIPGGAAGVAALETLGDAVHFVNEAFKHGKAIGATADGARLVRTSSVCGVVVTAPKASGAPIVDQGVVTAGDASQLAAFAAAFIAAIAKHRHWEREDAPTIPA